MQQVHSQVYYLTEDPKWEYEKPFYSNIPFDHPDSKQTNLESAPYDVTLSDIRGHEQDFHLEGDGFEVISVDLDMSPIYEHFVDPYWIQDNYYPRLDRWLRNFLGESLIERIYIYDHTVSVDTASMQTLTADFARVRRRDPNLPVESRGTQGALQPVPAAHTGKLPEAQMDVRTLQVSLWFAYTAGAKIIVKAVDPHGYWHILPS